MSLRAAERWLNILIFIAVLGLVFVVGYPQYKALRPSRVRIGVDESFGAVPFYVAERDTTRRYFLREKVIPKFIPIAGDPMEGLKQGEYDIAAVPWYGLILSPATERDTFKALGSLECRAVMDAIIVPKESKLKILEDLSNKKLGYAANDEYLVNLILNQLTQENVKDVVKVPLQPSEIFTAFQDKKAEALYLLEPNRGYLLYQGDTILTEGLIAKYIMPSPPYMAIVMRKNFLREDRLAATRIKNAIEATLAYLRLHPEIGKGFLLRIKNWPRNDTLLMNIRMPEYQRLTDIDLKKVERLQTFLVKAGIRSSGLKPQEFLFEKTDFTR